MCDSDKQVRRKRTPWEPQFCGVALSRRGWQRKAPSRGVVVVALIVCLAFVAGLAALLVNDLQTGLRDIQLAQRAAQTDWLVASAIDRARSQLKTIPDYKGETWRVPPEQMDGRLAGEVIIQVLPEQGGIGRRGLKVEATLTRKGSVLFKLTREEVLGPVTTAALQ